MLTFWHNQNINSLVVDQNPVRMTLIRKFPNAAKPVCITLWFHKYLQTTQTTEKVYIYIFKQALSFLDGRETGFVQVYLERGVELLKILAY